MDLHQETIRSYLISRFLLNLKNLRIQVKTHSQQLKLYQLGLQVRRKKSWPSQRCTVLLKLSKLFQIIWSSQKIIHLRQVKQKLLKKFNRSKSLRMRLSVRSRSSQNTKHLRRAALLKMWILTILSTSALSSKKGRKSSLQNLVRKMLNQQLQFKI